MKIKPKYVIKPEYMGKDVYTMKPSYERPTGAKFIINKDLSEKDKPFLFEVIGYEGIEKQ
jgi:hypothetical protein